MKDIIYLTADNRGVQAMRKSYTGARRGEVIIKLNVEVNPKAFTPPVLEQHVYVDEWQKGIDMDDVRFEKSIITPEEAELVRQKRLERMSEILESQGYQVTKQEEGEE